MLGSNWALRWSVIAGLRTAMSTLCVIRTEPLIRPFLSLMKRGITPTPLSPSGGHVKAYLKSYKRPDDYIYHFAHHMFAVRCKAEGVDQFTKFVHLVANTDWSSCDPATPPTEAQSRDSPLQWSPVIWQPHIQVFTHARCRQPFSQCVFAPNYSIINITEMTLSRMTAARRHLSAQLCKFCLLSLTGWSMAKYHPDLIFCRKQPGVGAYIVSILHFS